MRGRDPWAGATWQTIRATVLRQSICRSQGDVDVQFRMSLSSERYHFYPAKRSRFQSRRRWRRLNLFLLFLGLGLATHRRKLQRAFRRPLHFSILPSLQCVQIVGLCQLSIVVAPEKKLRDDRRHRKTGSPDKATATGAHSTPTLKSELDIAVVPVASGNPVGPADSVIGRWLIDRLTLRSDECC